MEKAFDSEIVMNLIYHIDYPCTAEVDGKTVDIRYFYLRIAEEVLPKLTNPFAKRALELKVKEYS